MVSELLFFPGCVMKSVACPFFLFQYIATFLQPGGRQSVTCSNPFSSSCRAAQRGGLRGTWASGGAGGPPEPQAHLHTGTEVQLRAGGGPRAVPLQAGGVPSAAHGLVPQQPARPAGLPQGDPHREHGALALRQPGAARCAGARRRQLPRVRHQQRGLGRVHGLAAGGEQRRAAGPGGRAGRAAGLAVPAAAAPGGPAAGGAPLHRLALRQGPGG